MKTRKLTFAAVAVAAALTLSACGSSAELMGTELQASARGTVDLTTYDGPVTFGNSGARTDAGSTTARVKANMSYSGGNWNINGEWKDGFVSFKFQGVSFLTACLLESGCSTVNLGPIAPFASKIKKNVKPLSSNESRGHYDESGWVAGGCMPFIAYYKSTNYAHPGVGQVIVVICDSANNGGTTGWTYPDYMAVQVPDTNSSGDASPYINYISGGYFTGRESGTSVAVRTTFQSPTATPSPLWTPVVQ